MNLLKLMKLISLRSDNVKLVRYARLIDVSCVLRLIILSSKITASFINDSIIKTSHMLLASTI